MQLLIIVLSKAMFDLRCIFPIAIERIALPSAFFFLFAEAAKGDGASHPPPPPPPGQPGVLRPGIFVGMRRSTVLRTAAMHVTNSPPPMLRDPASINQLMYPFSSHLALRRRWCSLVDFRCSASPACGVWWML